MSQPAVSEEPGSSGVDVAPVERPSGLAAILIVDDDPLSRCALRRAFDDWDHPVVEAGSGEQALALADVEEFGVVLLDIVMPGIDGYETCRRLTNSWGARDAQILFLSSRTSSDDKVHGLDVGAVDFIEKPFSAAEVRARVRAQLAARTRRRELTIRSARLERELAEARERVDRSAARDEIVLVGASAAAARLREEVARLADTAEPVRLEGDPGSAKENVARAIHARSRRALRPFVTVHCGRERLRDRTLLADARGGTVLLEQIHALDDEDQRTLLSYLDRAPDRSGEPNAPRWLVASHGRLQPAADEGRFRPELLDRLSANVLRVASIDERREDIPALALAWIATSQAARGKGIRSLSAASLARLERHRWRGGLRELESVVESAIARASVGESELDVSDDLLVSAQHIGGYRLLRPLGAGGMGVVWEAEHCTLQRAAAVKRIRPDRAADPARWEHSARRFRREAQATARLRSAHTIDVYDYGLENDTFYYAMELLDGVDLETLVREHGPLPPERVVWLLAQACRSLEEAHRAGLIHRDIKPANLVTCRLGVEHDFLKVLDFGIVEAFGDESLSTLTEDGERITGTPSFIAPEVVEKKGPVDHRVDIYALGCVAFWLLTGRRVFEGDSALEIFAQHATETPPPPSRFVSLPHSLESLVLACLEKSPQARPTTAAELARRLARVPFANPWSAERAEAWWQKNPIRPRPVRSPGVPGERTRTEPPS